MPTRRKFRVGIILIFTTGKNPPAFERGFKGKLSIKSARFDRIWVSKLTDSAGIVLVWRLRNVSSEKIAVI